MFTKHILQNSQFLLFYAWVVIRDDMILNLNSTLLLKNLW